MWRYWDYLAAGTKVACDKVYDYTTYYAFPKTREESDSDNEETDIEDSILDYNSILKVEKYIEVEEKGSKRILPEVGLWEEYSVFFSEPTHIVDNIYLGSAFNAATYQTLKEFNIKVIVNISKEITNYYDDEFIYHRYDLYDNNRHSILKHLKQAYRDVKHHQQNTEGNILIHCYMGASRSASVIIYYLMKNKKHDDGTSYTFDDALDFIKEKRSVVNPTFRLTKDLAKANMPH